MRHYNFEMEYYDHVTRQHVTLLLSFDRMRYRTSNFKDHNDDSFIKIEDDKLYWRHDATQIWYTWFYESVDSTNMKQLDKIINAHNDWLFNNQLVELIGE